MANRVVQLIHHAFKHVHHVYLVGLVAGVLVIIAALSSIYDLVTGCAPPSFCMFDVFVWYFMIPYVVGALFCLYEWEVDGEKTSFELTALHTISSAALIFSISNMKQDTGSKDYILILIVGYFLFMVAITTMYYQCRGDSTTSSPLAPAPAPLRCTECNKVI